MYFPPTVRRVLTASLLCMLIPACRPDDTQEQEKAPVEVTMSCDPAVDTCVTPNKEELVISLTAPLIGLVATQADVTVFLEVKAGELNALELLQNNEIVQTNATAKKGDTLEFGLTLKPGNNIITASATDLNGKRVIDSLTLSYTPQVESVAPVLTLNTAAIPATTWLETLPLSVTVVSQGEPTLEAGEDSLTALAAFSQESEGTWIGEFALALKPGEHTYTLIARADELPSESAMVTIEKFVDDTPPELELRSHYDEQDVHTRHVTLQGLASDENELAQLTLTLRDEERDVVLDADGSFAHVFDKLEPGDNLITLTAQDLGGNESSQTITLHYGSRLAAGGAHTGLLFEDTLYAFGRNNKGQLGLGYTSSLGDDQHAIIPSVVSFQTQAVAMAFSQNTSLVLDAQGQVWAWGDNGDGQLGLGDASTMEFDEDDRLEPTRIEGIEDAIAIARGYDHGMILREDGSVWTFGENSVGQLGHSPEQNRDIPIKVEGLTEIIQVAAGSKSSYALDAQGRVWAWGRNRYGNLGSGVVDDDAHIQPQHVDTLPEIAMIATGRDHVLALSREGEIFAWGLNASSQVGDESQGSDVVTPIKRADIQGVRTIHAQANQSFVLRDDEKLYGWGQNLNGTLGISEEEDVDSPDDPVFGLLNVRGVAIGALHGIARDAQGEVFAWGWSFEGSLGGGGDTIDRWAYRVPLLVDLPYAP